MASDDQKTESVTSPDSTSGHPDGKIQFKPGANLLRLRTFFYWLPGIIAVIISLLIYYRTTCPVVYYGDAGELIAAAWNFGNAHPPGYPSYIILLGLFLRLPLAWLAPDVELLQNIAWQANYFSGILGAATVGVIYAIIARLTRIPLIAFGGALLIATGQTLWAQSGIAEVYTLNALLASLMVLMALIQSDQPAGTTQRIKYMRWGSVIWGLSLANHHEMVFFFPLWITMVIMSLQPGSESKRPIFPPVRIVIEGMLFVGLGLLPYLYLPIAAAGNPHLNWGDPSTPGNFYDVLTRRVYTSIKSNISGDLVTSFDILLNFLYWTAVQYFKWILLLAIPGFIFIYKKSRYTLPVIGASVSILFMCAAFIMYFGGIDRASMFFLEVYFIPWYITIGVVATVGASGLVGLLKDKTPIVRTAAVLVAMLILVEGALIGYRINFTASDMSDNIQGYVYSSDVITTLPESPQKSILITEGDEIFLFWYWKWVEGIDKDIAVIGLDTLGSCDNWFWDDLERDQPELVLPCDEGLDQRYEGFEFRIRTLESLIRNNRGNYSVWSTNWNTVIESLSHSGPWHMVQDGPIVQLEWDSDGNMADYSRPGHPVEDYLFLRLLEVDREHIVPFEEIVYTNYGIACYNIAHVAYEAGDYDNAIEFAMLCLEFNPAFNIGDRYHSPHEIIAFSLFRAGYYDIARDSLEFLIEQYPENSVYHAYMAEIHYNSGDLNSAGAELETALSLEPDNEFYRLRLDAVIQESVPSPESTDPLNQN